MRVMMRRTSYSLLIVCEGSTTEPLYFEGIRDLIRTDDSLWPENIFIRIYPEPKVEDLSEVPASKHKTSRRRRRLATPVTDPELPGSPPIKYVRKAREELVDGTFDEAWAVFDRDNHPSHPEAFELAEPDENNLRVNIAFSSIAFEEWILMHFERSSKAFEKSVRRQGRVSFDCGTGTHPQDCGGNRCVIGYLRSKHYVHENPKKSPGIFTLLSERLEIARLNAAWLRAVNHSELPIYERNPYTDVDKLVSRLLQKTEAYEFLLLSVTPQTVHLPRISVTAYLVGNQVDVTISLLGTSSMIIPEGAILLLPHRSDLVDRQVLTPMMNTYSFRRAMSAEEEISLTWQSKTVIIALPNLP